MNVTGFDFHALGGFVPTRYTVHVNGPWCITFEFENGANKSTRAIPLRIQGGLPPIRDPKSRP